jgi:hypothetical protein
MVPVKPNYLKCCTPPYGGEQGRKGNRLPCPSKGIEYRSQRTYGGAAVSIRGAETSQVNAYQFWAVIPMFPGLNGSVSVRNFHLDDYPKHTQTETADA